MNKKILCLLLAAMMVLSLFAGCGGDTTSSKPVESKPATSTPTESGTTSTPVESGSTGIDMEGDPYDMYYMYYVSSEGSNQEKVNQAVNELSLKEINMTTHMLPMTFGTANQQISMMLASGEPLDQFVIGSGNFGTYIESQYIVNLNDYLPELQGAIEVLGDDAFAAQVGDFLCGFTQMKERCYPAGLVIRKDLFDELGYKVEDFNVSDADYSSFDQITEMFAAVKAKWPDMTVFDGTSIMALQTGSYFDNMGNMFGVLENYGQTTTVTNWFESEQYKKFCEIAKSWFDAGYLSKDIAVNVDSGEIKMKAGNTFCYMTNVKPNTNVEKKAQTGYDVEVVYVSDLMKNTNCVNAIVHGLANQSKDPRKAAQYLNWTYISQDFNDLINWGIQGEDWVLTDDGMAAYPDGVDASNVAYHNDYGFAYPNQFAGHPWIGNPPDIWDQYKKYNANLLTSKSFGFTFDSTVVANESAALQAIYDQYYKEIGFGATADIDAKIKEFNDALYAAGLQTVIDEKQRQLDEWLANQ